MVNGNDMNLYEANVLQNKLKNINNKMNVSPESKDECRLVMQEF